MVINGQTLINFAPIKDMVRSKQNAHGTSYGLGEAGYDIRIKQDIKFFTDSHHRMRVWTETLGVARPGRFALASAIEEFAMPANLVGIVHDKSTWARRGLSVFNTVIEPGWQGFLTLELVYHGEEELFIPAGSGIAQVVFRLCAEEARYHGKYANQPDRPVPARESL